MSVQLISGASADLWTIDPASKAGRVTLYDALGVEVKHPQQLTTYSAVSSAFTPGATPDDVFTITGAANKTVKVMRMWLSSTQTTAGVNTWFIRKRSTANSGGTSASAPAIPHRSDSAAASAAALQYTADPTLGTLEGDVWCGWVDSPGVLTTGTGLLVNVVDFIGLYGQPVCLLSAAQVLAWCFNGAALPAGLSVLAGVTWTEE